MIGEEPVQVGQPQGGLTEEAAVAENLDVRGQIDPHPMAQRLWVMEDSVTAANIRNIYGRVLAKRKLGAAAS